MTSAFDFVAMQVCLLSFPLSFLPPAHIIEQQLWNSRLNTPFWSSTTGQQFPYEPIGHSLGSAALAQEPSLVFRCSVRFFLVALCALLAAHVPCFGMVSSGGALIAMMFVYLSPFAILCASRSRCR